jgi:hypothetical protein
MTYLNSLFVDPYSKFKFPPMKPFATVLLFLIIASSCSPTKRLNRLLALHPELKVPDTIVINDTMITPQVEADTIIHLDSIHDTILIQKDRLAITLKRTHDTLYIRGKCKADKVIVHRTIPVEKIKIVRQDKWDNLISRLPWLVAGLIFTVLFIAFLISKFKK